jgi:hypothetical protein
MDLVNADDFASEEPGISAQPLEAQPADEQSQPYVA